MKLKQLSREFEYLTPKWQMFGHILLRVIAYIFILYITYHRAKLYTNISTNMDSTNIFQFLANFSQNFYYFTPKRAFLVCRTSFPPCSKTRFTQSVYYIDTHLWYKWCFGTRGGGAMFYKYNSFLVDYIAKNDIFLPISPKLGDIWN